MIPKLKITILLIMQRLGGSNSNGKNLKIAAKSYLTRQCNFFARRNLDWNGEWKFLFLSVNRNHNNNNKIAIPQIAQCFQFWLRSVSTFARKKIGTLSQPALSNFLGHLSWHSQGSFQTHKRRKPICNRGLCMCTRL